MAENVTKVPVKQGKSEKPSSTLQTWQPFEGLRDEIDRLFDDLAGACGSHSVGHYLQWHLYSGAK